MIKLLPDNLFEVPGAWTYRVKPAPDRKYHANSRTWTLPNTVANRKFLLGNFLPTDFEAPALAAANAPAKLVPDGFPPVPKWPATVYHHGDGETYDVLPHQLEALNLAWGKPGFAFFHEMGSGKSLTQLLFWDALFKADLIDEAWVVCPNSIIDNWHEQVANWTPWLKDKIEVYGVLSLSAGKLPAELVRRSHQRLAVAVDESQRIKNAQAKRTRVMHEVGKNAGFQSILTGTPITKGVEDLYSQYYYLDPTILGYKSFYSFRNKYCMMGGFNNKQIVGYQNMGELMDLVAPYTHVVKDPVKLPPHSHETRMVALAPEQKRLLSELKGQMQTEMAGNKITVANALAYFTRGAQILGGFFPLANGEVMTLPTQPKIDELIEIVQGTDKKIVVFCRFIPEAKMITEALRDIGVPALRLGSDIEDKQAVINAFQTDPQLQVIVSTYAMGSVGFTMTAGSILIKYSGTFNFEDDEQSERRIRRIGQKNPMMFIRILAQSKLDKHIAEIARKKQTLADFVTGSLTNPKILLDLME